MSHRFHQRKKKGFLDCVSRHCAQLEQIVRKADASGATGKLFFKKQSNENREPVPFQWRVRPANSNSERPTTQFLSKFNNGTRKRFNWVYPVLIGETSICQLAYITTHTINSDGLVLSHNKTALVLCRKACLNNLCSLDSL